MGRGGWWATVRGVAKSQTRASDEAHHSTGEQLSRKQMDHLTLGFFIVMLNSCRQQICQQTAEAKDVSTILQADKISFRFKPPD